MNIVREAACYALLSKGTKATVVGISHENGQVYSAMPSDHPQDGGRWYARISDEGVEYVANWYSKSYARRIFNQLVKEAEETLLSY